MVADDFGPSNVSGGGSKAGTAAADKGQKRNWLRVFETLPPQLLNALGPSKYAKMPDEDMWKELNVPLATGASCMTELCLPDAQRRGVGINRWLAAVQAFLPVSTWRGGETQE